MDWYKFVSNKSLEKLTGVHTYYEIKKYYCNYNSILYTNYKSWTGLYFWRTKPFQTLDASKKESLIAIINADEQDYLEIGFRETNFPEREDKIILKVEKSWAGYVIPLTSFETVNFNSIQLFFIAHTAHLRDSDHSKENTFKISLLALR